MPVGAELSKDVNMPKKFAKDIPLVGGKDIPMVGGKKILSAGKIGKGRGRAVGMGLAAVGAIGGAAIGGTAYAKSYVNRNRDFFEQSPYSRGSAMQASSTNAYGDMVLGMHNSRRG